MSQSGSNLRLSQLHPLRPSHTDQSQGSKVITDTHTDRQIDRKSISRNRSAYRLCDLKIVITSLNSEDCRGQIFSSFFFSSSKQTERQDKPCWSVSGTGTNQTWSTCTPTYHLPRPAVVEPQRQGAAQGGGDSQLCRKGGFMVENLPAIKTADRLRSSMLSWYCTVT